MDIFILLTYKTYKIKQTFIKNGTQKSATLDMV